MNVLEFYGLQRSLKRRVVAWVLASLYNEWSLRIEEPTC